MPSICTTTRTRCPSLPWAWWTTSLPSLPVGARLGWWITSAMKRLQFGTPRCIKLHVGKTRNETLCSDLFVGGWKVDVVEDTETGLCGQTEHFGGMEMMKEKQEQMYLGDIISADGSHAKNIQHRKNKGQGTINQIIQILDSVYFGKYYFEVAIVLRSSLLLSSLLWNSEAWVNITDKDIRSFLNLLSLKPTQAMHSSIWNWGLCHWDLK